MLYCEMLTVFERAVFRQFLVINVIYLCVILGLFTVIDLFDNVDDFVTHGDNNSLGEIVASILVFYGRLGLFIFDAAALPLISVSLLTSLLLLRRKGQIKPFLSAGIPTYRVLGPALMLGVLAMVGLKTLNREVLLSNAVHHLHSNRGKATTRHAIAPRYDYASQILIDGWSVFPDSNRIEKAAFVLPPEIAGNEMICLRAEEAQFYAAQGTRPSGWLLRESQPRMEDIPLTEAGKRFLLRSKQPENVFVVTDVTPDLIYKAKESTNFLSTEQLLTRVSSPAIDAKLASDLEFNLHTRVIEPVLTVVLVWIAIPLVLQSESKGAITAASNCGFWLFGVLGSTYAVKFLVGTQLIAAVMAAWVPLFFATLVASWVIDRVET